MSAVEQENWLQQNTVDCRRYAARLSPRACAGFRSRAFDGCAGCEHAERPAANNQSASNPPARKHHKNRMQRPQGANVKVEKLVLAFETPEARGTLRRLRAAAAKNKTTLVDEVMIYIEACLDNQGVK